jgi:hypothetical protein
VEFKYEKLPLFCFRCGRIVHGPRGCPIPAGNRTGDRDEPKQWGSWLRAIDPKRRGTNSGSGFRRGAYSNQARDGDEVDGAQSDVRGVGIDQSVFSGNPIRGTTLNSPDRSADSGTFHNGNIDRNNRRKEQGNKLFQEASSELGAQGTEDSQRESQQTICWMGQGMGQKADGHIGPTDKVGGGSHEDASPNTIMEVPFPAEATNLSMDENAGASRPNLNVKKWKRLARKVTQSSISPRATKRGKRDRATTVASQTNGGDNSEKRMRVIETTYGQPMEILAAAVEQPHQEP